MSKLNLTAAPPSGGSAIKVDWHEMDIDELVERLTPGEIQKLLEEFDPDDPHLPPSERCAYRVITLILHRLEMSLFRAQTFVITFFVIAFV